MEILEISHAQMAIREWVKTFDYHGSVKSTSVREGPSVSREIVCAVSTLFHTHPQRQLNRTVIDLPTPYYTIQKV